MMNRRLAIAALAIVALATACSSSSSGNPHGGVDVELPPTLTHGVCAVVKVDYLSIASVPASPAPAENNETYTATAQNGALYFDADCKTPLSGTFNIPRGSVSVNLGLVPGKGGMTCEAQVSNTATFAGVPITAQASAMVN